MWQLAHELNFGALGVKCFFVISGFLVTQSWLARNALVPFVAARVLRIYPALIAAMLFTIVLAGVSSSLRVAAISSPHPQTLDYAWRVALGWEMVYRLPDVFAQNPFPHAVNGSLWTLPIELRLYVAVLVAGSAGIAGAADSAWLAAVARVVVALRRAAGLVSAIAERRRRARTRAAVRAGIARVGVARRDPGVAAPARRSRCCWSRGIPAASPRGALFAPLLAYVVLVVAYHPRLRVAGRSIASATTRTDSTSIRFPCSRR